ncbi:MAG: DUF1622 domain-containing protein [Treponemataceae bacterium]
MIFLLIYFDKDITMEDFTTSIIETLEHIPYAIPPKLFIVLEIVSLAISVISMIVIVYATLMAMLAFSKVELRRFNRSKVKYSIHRLRVLRADFGTYLLWGLELLIAADILKTILEPSFQELCILGGIVVLRTVLSFFLNKEIQEIDEQRYKHPEDFEK